MSFDQSWLTIGGMTMLVMAAVQFTKRSFRAYRADSIHLSR